MSLDRVRLTELALDDLRGLHQQDPALVVEALRVIKRVDQRQLSTKPLRPFGKTGDLSDCSRAYFGATPDADTHRIVFRQTGDTIEILQVVAVDERRGDLAYLVAALRLGRIRDPIRRSDAQRAVSRLRAKRPGTPPPCHLVKDPSRNERASPAQARRQVAEGIADRSPLACLWTVLHTVGTCGRTMVEDRAVDA